jgi:hypothetical protein
MNYFYNNYYFSEKNIFQKNKYLGKSWEFLLNKHTHNTLQSKAGFASKKSFSFTKLQKMPPCYQT